jgi:hypothetical protein
VLQRVEVTPSQFAGVDLAAKVAPPFLAIEAMQVWAGACLAVGATSHIVFIRSHIESLLQQAAGGPDIRHVPVRLLE